MTEYRPNMAFPVTELQPEALAQEPQKNLGVTVPFSDLISREHLVRVGTVQDLLAIERAEGEGMSGPGVVLISGTEQTLQQPEHAVSPATPKLA